MEEWRGARTTFETLARHDPAKPAPPGFLSHNGCVTLEMPRRQSVAVGEAARAALIETTAADPGVVAAYLFGSLARGTAGPLSDVDVALLIRDAREADAICERTMDALCRRLRTGRVEVIS